MAHAAGGGAGPSMAGSGYSVIADFLEEEKKRKQKEAVRQAAQKAAAKANVKPAAKGAAMSVTATKLRRLDPHTSTREEIEAAVKQIHTNALKTQTPLVEYIKTARKTGDEQALLNRVKQATSIWRRYLKPYDGPSSVWAMVSSPLGMDELETLASRGQQVLFNYLGNKKNNYLPSAMDDGHKDTRLFHSTVGLGLGAAFRSGGKEEYQLNPFGYQGVNPMDIMGMHNEEYLASPEGQANLAFLEQHEKWYTEHYLQNKSLVEDLEGLVGVKKSEYSTWQEWEGVLKEKSLDLGFTEYQEFERAYADYVGSRSTYVMTEHRPEMQARGTGTLAKLGMAAAQAALMKYVPAGLARWGHLTRAGKLGALLGGVMLGGYVAGPRFAGEVAGERVAQAKLEEYEAAVESQATGGPRTPAQIQVDQLKMQVSRLSRAGDRESIKKIQEELQQPIYDIDGTLIRPALGKGLIADGILNSAWMSVIDQAADIAIGATVAVQQMLIASGYASKDLKITGTFEKYNEETEEWESDEEWQKALEAANEDWEKQVKLAENHPYLYSFLNNAGIPMTWQGLNALIKRMSNEGLLHLPLRALTQTAHTIGGIFVGAPSMLELHSRLNALHADPARKEKQDNLVQMVAGMLPEDTSEIPFDVSPATLSPSKAQWMVENGYIENENARLIVNELNQEEFDVISASNHSWMGAIAHSTMESKDADKWLSENIDLVHSVNMGIDILGTIGVVKVSRGVNKGVGRTAEAFTQNGKIRRDVRRMVRHANRGEMGEVGQILGLGADNATFLRRIGDYRYQKDVFKDPKHPDVQSLASELAPLAREGKVTEIVERLKLPEKDIRGAARKNATEWAESLVEMAKKHQEVAGERVTLAQGKLAAKEAEAAVRAAERYDRATLKQVEKARNRGYAERAKLHERRVEAEAQIREKYEKRYKNDPYDKYYEHPKGSEVYLRKDDYINELVETETSRRFKPREEAIVARTAKKIEEINNKRSEKRADYLSTRAEAWERAHGLRVPRAKSLEDKVAARLVYRQHGKGDVFGTRPVDDYLPQVLQEMWTGADGKTYDIMPHHVLNRPIQKKNYSRIWMESTIARIPNNRLRVIVGLPWLATMRAPLRSYSKNLPDFPNRVADGAGSITNDMWDVARFRTKAAMMDPTNPMAFNRLQNEFLALKEDRLQTGAYRSRSTSFLRGHRTARETEGIADQLTGLKIAGKEGEGAEFVGRYEEKMADGSVQQREVIMSTAQEAHEFYMGGDILWAKLRTPENANAFAYAHIKAANVSRSVEGALMAINTPLRIVSVGSGAPVLFTKHTICDTGRSVVEEGAKVLNLPGNKKGFYERIQAAGQKAADYALFSRKVTIETEQHYQLDGGLLVKRAPQKAFSRGGRFSNRQAAIDTVRRIIMDDGFRRFSEGGVEGLLAWLRSPEGWDALSRHGAVKESKQILRAEGKSKEVRGDDFRDFVIQRYKDMYLELFQNYAELPRLSQAMLEMARGTRPRHEGAIRDAIIDAYKKGGENPVVDVAFESGNPLINFFSKMTKGAMTPNRMNREGVFYKVFNEVYDDLVKNQHVKPEDAAVIASSVAKGRALKVHFDLSQAMRIEMKHRWFAWFFTKHRLWNTYLMTAAAKYPGLAGAAHEFLDWMEERNTAEGVPEWEKYNIRFKAGGRQVSINMAPWTWLMEYAVQSAAGSLVQDVSALSLKLITGTDVIPTSPNDFPLTLTRLDAVMGTIMQTLRAAKPLSSRKRADWQEWYDDLPAERQEDVAEKVQTIWALSGGEKDISDCYAEALLGYVKHEAFRFFKPSSTKFTTDDTYHLEEMRREFESLEGNYVARREYLRLHPDFAAVLGVGKLEPYEQAELVQYQSLYYEIRNRYSTQVTRAFIQGKLEDPGFAKSLYLQEQIEIKELEKQSPVFSDWLNRTGEASKAFGEIAHNVFPLVPMDDWEASRIPNSDEVEVYKERELIPKFDAACEAYGLNPSSTSMAVQMLRDRYINEPLAKFKKELPGDLDISVKNNARLLAENDNMGGFFRSTQYIEMMTSKKKREFWLAGIKAGKPDTNNLIMSKYTTEEKQWAGWRSEDGVWDMWFQWALRNDQINAYAGAMDWGPNKKETKQMKEALRREVEEIWLPQNPTFAQEWNFSQMRLYERMNLMGYGSGESRAQQGWRECLDIVEGLWSELDSIYNRSTGKPGVTAMSQAAAGVNRTYLRKLVDLTEKNKEWYWEWKLLGLGPTKMGFYSRWKLHDGSDWEIWKRDAPVPYEEYEYYFEE